LPPAAYFEELVGNERRRSLSCTDALDWKDGQESPQAASSLPERYATSLFLKRNKTFTDEDAEHGKPSNGA